METRNSSTYKTGDVGKKVIAVFDFDGTITRHDTFLSFSWFALGPIRFLLKTLFAFFPVMIRITYANSLSEGKEMLLNVFFKDWNETDFLKTCRDYTTQCLPYLIRSEALEKIRWHKTQGHTLVILSASLVSWIEPWAEENGFQHVIATIPEINQGKLTGRFSTPNCVGEEKKKRLLKAIPNLQDFEIYAYGNSRKDKPFLSLADYSFYKRF